MRAVVAASFAASLAACVALTGAVFAQDSVPLAPAGPKALTPAAPDAQAPAAGDAGALTVTARPRTPDELVDKSVRDLSHGDVGAAVKDDVKALRRGPLLIHGNYCGIGNRPGTKPVDALDAACMRHDACTTTGAMPNCACDDRLRQDATAIAQDPATAPAMQVMATAVASSMAVLVCK